MKSIRDSPVQREDLISQEEIMAMIDAADHLRDKAFISVLADSGTRIGEIGDLIFKNICFDDYGATISVDGKTGKRSIRLTYSVPDFSRWLSIHPFKDNENAPVWVNIGTRSRGEKIRYDTFNKILKKTAKKAGINKRIFPHLFRHSRSTDLANHLSDSQLNAQLGWVPGSNMPRTYVHLAAKDVGETMLSLCGHKDKIAKPFLTDKPCSRCNTRNSPASSMCSQCGCSLNLKATMDLEEVRKELSIKITELISKYPQVNIILQENLSAV